MCLYLRLAQINYLLLLLFQVCRQSEKFDLFKSYRQFGDQEIKRLVFFFINWCSPFPRDRLLYHLMHENLLVVAWRRIDWSLVTWYLTSCAIFQSCSHDYTTVFTYVERLNTQCLCSKSASYAFLPISLTLFLSVGPLLLSSTWTTLLPCSCCSGFASTLHAFKREEWFTKEHLTCKAQ